MRAARNLSTPSLGITDEENCYGRTLELRLEAFNSLSRDHRSSRRIVLRATSPEPTFNSLSRDHRGVGPVPVLSQIAFNSLSRDHTGDPGSYVKFRLYVNLSTPSLGITRKTN